MRRIDAVVSSVRARVRIIVVNQISSQPDLESRASDDARLARIAPCSSRTRTTKVTRHVIHRRRRQRGRKIVVREVARRHCVVASRSLTRRHFARARSSRSPAAGRLARAIDRCRAMTSPSSTRVKLWDTNAGKKRYDDYATLFALARAIEKLERAYVRSAIADDEYERTCIELMGKFKTLRAVLLELGPGEGVPDLDAFFEAYGARVPSARRRLEVGVPATLEHHAGRGGRANDRYANEAKYVAEATHCFITVLDTLKLDMRAKDQVAPALGDLLVALHKVTRVPKDFAGTAIARKWMMKLDTMRASESFSEDEVRELLYEVENAYGEFMRILSSATS